MNGYLVHFSRQSDKDYTQTEQYLRSFDSFCRLSANADTWIVGTPDIGQALTIRDQMLKLSPPNTQIFVLRLDFNETAWSAQEEISNWLEAIYKPTPEQLAAEEQNRKKLEELTATLRKERERDMEMLRQQNEKLNKLIAKLEQSNPPL